MDTVVNAIRSLAYVETVGTIQWVISVRFARMVMQGTLEVGVVDPLMRKEDVHVTERGLYNKTIVQTEEIAFAKEMLKDQPALFAEKELLHYKNLILVVVLNVFVEVSSVMNVLQQHSIVVLFH
jgi:hypothetical protein